MGRQWLHAKREVANLKKGQLVGKLVKEIMVAVRQGGEDPKGNARLAAALEKARKSSVPKESIERALKKASGSGGEKMELSHLVFEGYAPHKVPVIIEALTDNPNRTTPEIRLLFRTGQLGTAGSNKFLFDQVGIVEAHQATPGMDLEEVAIEAGANEVLPLSHSDNDDIPEDRIGAKFLTDRNSAASVTRWLVENGWTVTTCELGYTAKTFPTLDEAALVDVSEFLQNLQDHDDVHRVWAALS